MLSHLIKKDKPFEYIDTHSGAGLYNLQSIEAQKLQEHTYGIGQLNVKDFPELARYFEVIQSLNTPNTLEVYPGSPAIAQYFMRPQDSAWLFEIHPQDYELLRENMRNMGNMGNRKKIRVRCDDYKNVIEHVVGGYKKFSTGMYAIWYPVVDRKKIAAMETQLLNSGIRNIQRFELGIAEDSNERGMTASGMIVINPPWTLFNTMFDVLPKLAQRLTRVAEPSFKCDVLSVE